MTALFGTDEEMLSGSPKMQVSTFVPQNFEISAIKTFHRKTCVYSISRICLHYLVQGYPATEDPWASNLAKR